MAPVARYDAPILAVAQARFSGVAPAADVTVQAAAPKGAIREALLIVPGQGDAQAARPAQVTVRLPAEARLWVDGVACPLTSDTRTFATPQLHPGQQYAYTLRAEVVRDGQTITQNQRVLIGAGRQVDVTFGDLSPASPTQR